MDDLTNDLILARAEIKQLKEELKKHENCCTNNMERICERHITALNTLGSSLWRYGIIGDIIEYDVPYLINRVAKQEELITQLKHENNVLKFSTVEPTWENDYKKPQEEVKNLLGDFRRLRIESGKVCFACKYDKEWNREVCNGCEYNNYYNWKYDKDDEI